ncbi:hypothetical protein J6590_023769 [Homalodisca vitripennis]|nr:hypothetical protein J6590_023769 [Homalodisca vitripennis]
MFGLGLLVKQYFPVDWISRPRTLSNNETYSAGRLEETQLFRITTGGTSIKSQSTQASKTNNTNYRHCKVRAKKPSLTLNLGTNNGSKVTCEPPTTNGRAGGMLARTGSLSGHPSKQQPRSTLLDPVIRR